MKTFLKSISLSFPLLFLTACSGDSTQEVMDVPLDTAVPVAEETAPPEGMTDPVLEEPVLQEEEMKEPTEEETIRERESFTPEEIEEIEETQTLSLPEAIDETKREESIEVLEDLGLGQPEGMDLSGLHVYEQKNGKVYAIRYGGLDYASVIAQADKMAKHLGAVLLFDAAATGGKGKVFSNDSVKSASTPEVTIGVDESDVLTLLISK